MWESVVACLATLDVLIAMATYSSGGEMCRPKVTLASPDQSPYVDIRSGRHPCVNLSGEDFIPNDLIINCNEVYNIVLNLTCLGGLEHLNLI